MCQNSIIDNRYELIICTVAKYFRCCDTMPGDKKRLNYASRNAAFIQLPISPIMYHTQRPPAASVLRSITVRLKGLLDE